MKTTKKKREMEIQRLGKQTKSKKEGERERSRQEERQ